MAKFRAIKKIAGDEVLLSLEGVLDGTVDFEKVVGTFPAKLTIDCSRVLHANSSLVNAWIRYFTKAREAGTVIKLTGCTTPIIEYINFVPAFRCGATVESVHAPFFCPRCERNFSVLVQIVDAKVPQDLIDNQRCPSCNTAALFDDNAALFFTFLENANSP